MSCLSGISVYVKVKAQSYRGRTGTEAGLKHAWPAQQGALEVELSHFGPKWPDLHIPASPTHQMWATCKRT